MACLAGFLLNALTCILHVGAMTVSCEWFRHVTLNVCLLSCPCFHNSHIRIPPLMWTQISQCHLYPKMSLCWGSSQLCSQ
ncbi:hypothetical protein EDD17DRAFT_1616324 [Pisolithus thermaeus]|nr:hypothetical protein EDD17DRAFT_1616324 [Pisolithus thermaeus]